MDRFFLEKQKSKICEIPPNYACFATKNWLVIFFLRQNMRDLQPKQKQRKKIIFCLKLFSERTTQDEKIPKPVPSSVDFALLDEQLIRRQNIDIPRQLQGYNIVDWCVLWSRFFYWRKQLG